MSGTSNDEYLAYKWEVLGDAVDEDWQGLWEPLWWARTRFPDLSPTEREALAERVLRELLSEGLIHFVSAGPWPGHRLRDTVPLDSSAAVSAISGTSWRTLPLEDASIWFGGTEAGERAVRTRWPDSVK
jgi:hypothetical protein